MNSLDPQPADPAEKRRKQIEKAKAAHLSRQLQTRLQYARLKVDHGWQKQTLNEVENLYFHHYHARTPAKKTLKFEKSSAGSSQAQSSSKDPGDGADPTGTLTQSLDETQEHPAAGTSQSTASDEDDSSKMELDALPETPTNDTKPASPISSAAVVTGPHIHEPASPIFVPPAPHPPTAAQSSPPAKRRPLSEQQLASFRSQCSSFSIHAPTTHPTAPAASPGPLPQPRPVSSLSLPAQISPARSGTQSPGVKASQIVASASMSGASNVALTYDSFWSSHSATANNYRSTLMSSASYPNLSKGETRVSLSTLGNGYALSVGAAGASIQPLSPQTKATIFAKPSTPRPAGSAL